MKCLLLFIPCLKIRSRPARGAWVEIKKAVDHEREASGRAPQGARGLKFDVMGTSDTKTRRAPQGARGLKYNESIRTERKSGRAPQGARGLKVLLSVGVSAMLWSRPARGAWVEI